MTSRSLCYGTNSLSCSADSITPGSRCEGSPCSFLPTLSCAGTATCCAAATPAHPAPDNPADPVGAEYSVAAMTGSVTATVVPALLVQILTTSRPATRRPARACLNHEYRTSPRHVVSCDCLATTSAVVMMSELQLLWQEVVLEEPSDNLGEMLTELVGVRLHAMAC